MKKILIALFIMLVYACSSDSMSQQETWRAKKISTQNIFVLTLRNGFQVGDTLSYNEGYAKDKIVLLNKVRDSTTNTFK